MIQYEDTSYKKLTLGYALRNIDVSSLNIIDKKEIGDIEYGVLGASHYFKIGNKFTEVFACRPLKNIDYSNNIFDVGDQLYIDNDQMSYLFESSIIEDIHEIEKYFVEFNNKGSLEIKFPTIQNNLPFEAVTYINLDKIGDEIKISSLHSYPEENKIVITKTTVKLKQQ